MGVGRADVEALSSFTSLTVEPYERRAASEVWKGFITEGQPTHTGRTAHTYRKDQLPSPSHVSLTSHHPSQRSVRTPSHPPTPKGIAPPSRGSSAGTGKTLRVGSGSCTLGRSLRCCGPWPVRVPHVSVDVFFGASDTHFPFSSTVSDGEGKRRREAHCTVRKT